MTNKTLYFLSQTYRQIQLSVDKGTVPYPHSDFARQFDTLLTALDNEEAARTLVINLVEEAANAHENTDYFRRRLAEEADV
jgi:hypothetical protein